MSKDIKFKLTTETKVNLWGVKLFRIEATCDIKERGVKKGDKGGWVESKEVNGDARVSGDAWVYGNARVYGDALSTGYCFAYKANDWDVTEVPTKDGSGVLLIKDYKEPEETDTNTIEIEGKEYTITEIKKALGKDIKV